MDWPALFVIALLAASWPVMRSPWLVLVMWANLGAGYALDWDLRGVAIADLACAAALMMGTQRMVVVATLFLAMVPLYGLAYLGQWQHATTYAIVDVLAYGQLLVMGRADAGLGRLGRYLRGWVHSVVGGAASDKGSVAVVSRADRKVKVTR